MGNKKQLTEDQLESLGTLYVQMHKDAIKTWEIGMIAFPVKSAEYTNICSAGKQIQKFLFKLIDKAIYDFKWSEEKRLKIFGEVHYYTFL